MIWNVYRYVINARKIQVFNVLDHSGIVKDLEKLRKKKLSKEEFAEELRQSLFYYFGSKSEYEVVVGPWVGSRDFEKEAIKVDIYAQVRLNWEVFVDYVWEVIDG